MFIPKRCVLLPSNGLVHAVFVAAHFRLHNVDRLPVDKTVPTVRVVLNGGFKSLAVPEGNEAHASVAVWYEASECFTIAFQKGMNLPDTVNFFSVADGYGAY